MDIDRRLADALSLARHHRFDEVDRLLEGLQAEALKADASARLSLIQGLKLLYLNQLADGLALALPALNRLRSPSDLCELAWCHGAVGFKLGYQGNPEQGLEYVGRALAYLKDDSPEELSLIKGWQGCLFDMAGDVEHARESLTQSIDIARAHGLPLRETLSAGNLSFMHVRQAERAEREADAEAVLFHAEQALALADQALARQQGLEPLKGGPRPLRHRAHALALLGRLDEAEEAIAVAASTDAQLQDMSFQMSCLCIEARLARMRGRFDIARRKLDEALAMGTLHGEIADMDTVLRDAVDVEIAAGRWPEALAATRRHTAFLEAQYRRRLQMVTRHAEVFAEAERTRIQADALRRQAGALAEDNERLTQRERHWQDQALRDPLTGLSNRRGLEEAAGALIAAELPCAMAVVDVDFFKRVNDQFGHPMGDAVLCELARLLTKDCRPSEWVARLGGEEFVLVFSGDAIAQAARICERLRASVEAHDWAQLHPELRVTISLGLAGPAPASTWAAVLDRADQSLYAAKQAGRNRLQVDTGTLA